MENLAPTKGLSIANMSMYCPECLSLNKDPIYLLLLCLQKKKSCLQATPPEFVKILIGFCHCAKIVCCVNRHFENVYCFVVWLKTMCQNLPCGLQLHNLEICLILLGGGKNFQEFLQMQVPKSWPTRQRCGTSPAPCRMSIRSWRCRPSRCVEIWKLKLTVMAQSLVFLRRQLFSVSIDNPFLWDSDHSVIIISTKGGFVFVVYLFVCLLTK